MRGAFVQNAATGADFLKARRYLAFCQRVANEIKNAKLPHGEAKLSHARTCASRYRQACRPLFRFVCVSVVRSIRPARSSSLVRRFALT